MASQPHLLANVLKLNETQDESKLSYYHSQRFIELFNANIGDTTIYDEIHQLIPNHFIDFNIRKPIRFWPNQTIYPRLIDEAAEISARVIKGYLDAIASRHQIMLPLTSGKDSRTLLSATKEISNRVYYYINKDKNLDDKNVDIVIPQKVISDLGFKFNILNQPESVDKDFSEIYFYNNKYASLKYLPIIYNYYLSHSDKVNLPGNMASCGYEYYKYYGPVSPLIIAKLSRVECFSYAVEYYRNWFNNCREICSDYNFALIPLFYWEERLGNWGTQVQIDKDIAQEEINLFNSRYLLDIFFSVNDKYIIPPGNRLHKQIMKILWPEVLKFPINPGPTNSLKKILFSMGLLKSFYRITHRF